MHRFRPVKLLLANARFLPLAVSTGNDYTEYVDNPLVIR
jgi:hypothetical protein